MYNVYTCIQCTFVPYGVESLLHVYTFSIMDIHPFCTMYVHVYMYVPVSVVEG